MTQGSRALDLTPGTRPLDEDGEACILVEGLLVGGGDRHLDIVLTPYLFSLDRDALLDIEIRPDCPRLIPGRARWVRLRLSKGVRLLGLCSSTDMEAELWRCRRSFPVVTRLATPERSAESEEQRAVTRTFLARFGISSEECPIVPAA